MTRPRLRGRPHAIRNMPGGCPRRRSCASSARGSGPSGANPDYVRSTHEHCVAMGVTDPVLARLVAALQRARPVVAAQIREDGPALALVLGEPVHVHLGRARAADAAHPARPRRRPLGCGPAAAMSMTMGGAAVVAPHGEDHRLGDRAESRSRRGRARRRRSAGRSARARRTGERRLPQARRRPQPLLAHARSPRPLVAQDPASPSTRIWSVCSPYVLNIVEADSKVKAERGQTPFRKGESRRRRPARSPRRNATQATGRLFYVPTSGPSSARPSR